VIDNYRYGNDITGICITDILTLTQKAGNTSTRLSNLEDYIELDCTFTDGYLNIATIAGTTSMRLSNLEDYIELDCTFTDGLP